MRPEGNAHKSYLHAPPPLCVWQSTAALTKGDFECSCWSLPPALRLLQVCIQSDGGEVLEVLRSQRNLSLGGASQSFSLKRCQDMLGTFQSLLVLKRVLVFSGVVRAGSLTADVCMRGGCTTCEVRTR